MWVAPHLYMEFAAATDGNMSAIVVALSDPSQRYRAYRWCCGKLLIRLARYHAATRFVVCTWFEKDDTYRGSSYGLLKVSQLFLEASHKGHIARKARFVQERKVRSVARQPKTKRHIKNHKGHISRKVRFVQERFVR